MPVELAQSPTSGQTTLQPSPSPTLNPPPNGLQQTGAIVAILFALAAAILGYRILRGGRGL